jgi:hypothetical protein
MTVLNIFDDAQQLADRTLVRHTRALEIQRASVRRKKIASPIAAPAALGLDLADRHALLIGGTRKGKSVILQLICRALVAHGAEGLSIIDPHGSFARALIEWLAHPSSGQHGRIVHIIDPASAHCIGLNPLRPYDGSWEAAHDAAMLIASVTESRFEASPEETPRLARIVYIGGMLCARHGLTLLELVELLSLGGEELRRSLLEDFDNRIVRRELEDLCLLADRSPREFLNLVESTKNRFVKWLGDRRLARILGQKNGLDVRAVMDNRELVIADLSALTYSDAALVGTIYASVAFAASRRRRPLQCARHRLILDEAESLITLDVARLCDQSAKWGVSIVAAIQRLGQLRARDDFIADALLTNCAVKICFGGLEHESARYMAENLFAGHVDLAEWKLGTERPTAVRQSKIVLKNKTRSKQHSESQSSDETHTRSTAHTVARMRASMSSMGSGSGTGATSSFVSMPADQMLGTPPAVSKTTGRSTSTASSVARASSFATSSSHQYAFSYGRSEARATSTGSSLAEGESEALATVYQDLPTEIYSLEEQLFRLTAELMNLARREVIVRLENEAPFRARTVDCFPAFRSAEFKAELLPRYLLNAARRSRYAVLASDVDREIAMRIDDLVRSTIPAEPDLAPEPMPVPTNFATQAHELFRTLQSASGKTPLRLVPGGKDGDSGR